MSCPSAPRLIHAGTSLIGHLFVETQNFASLRGFPLETHGNDNKNGGLKTPATLVLLLTGQVAEQADATASKAVGLRARKGSTPFLPILR